jgi:hypothetical protein
VIGDRVTELLDIPAILRSVDVAATRSDSAPRIQAKGQTKPSPA